MSMSTRQLQHKAWVGSDCGNVLGSRSVLQLGSDNAKHALDLTVEISQAMDLSFR